MPITSLHFTNVGPFDDIEFEFDPQVNVFTGPNNSGKSTALWVLGELLVWPFVFPGKLLRAKGATWDAKFIFGQKARQLSGSIPVPVSQVTELLEQIGYTTFVPAIRRSTDFRSKGPSITRPWETTIGEQELEDLVQRDPRRFAKISLEQLRQSAREPEGPDLQKRRASFSSDAYLTDDEAVIQKVVDLDYRAYRQNAPSIRGIINNIATITSEITDGFDIQFLGVAEDEGGLFPQFRTPDGDLPLNVFSQGTQSIIQWLAHLLIGYAEYYEYPANLEEKPGILIIDEIDAHLHPSWQRRIIPTLTKHFPNLQIFCSTHSPLMLAGLKAGQVQLLRRDEQGKVTVSRNEDDIKGWSADEILRNVLDVPNPTDLETVGHLERLAELRRKETLSEEETAELERLRYAVSQDLLGGPIAGQLEQLTALLERAKAEMLPNAYAESLPKAQITRRRRKPSS